MTWVKAKRLDEFEQATAIKLPTCPPVAVFAADGEYFALDDKCTHGNSSLSDGYIDDCKVECVFHYAIFDLRTGAPLTLPATLPQKTYPVRQTDGWLEVDLPDELLAAPSEQQRAVDQTEVDVACSSGNTSSSDVE